MSVTIPDYFESLVGWRLWSSFDPNTGGLKALANNYYWMPGKTLAARCDSCGSPAKPAFNNHVGMYAFKNLLELVKQDGGGFTSSRWSVHGSPIVGQVYLWGTILDCEFGYRAQFAYPKALLIQHITDEHLQMLRKLWRIPVDKGNIHEIFDKAKRAAAKQRGVDIP